jgi:hypothetical protein
VSHNAFTDIVDRTEIALGLEFVLFTLLLALLDDEVATRIVGNRSADRTKYAK